MRTRFQLCLIVLLAFSLTAAWADNEKVYFGILHSHTGYSDGMGLPPEAYQHARDVGHCDFFAITEHNHHISISPKGKPGEPIPDRKQMIAFSPENYNGGPNSLAHAAEEATNSTFVALYGQEFSTQSCGNHTNVFDVPNVIKVDKGEYPLLVDWLNKAAQYDTTGQVAIMQFNHPDPNMLIAGTQYGRDKFTPPLAWYEQLSPLVCTIEVLNGTDGCKPGTRPFPGYSAGEAAYQYYLAEGFRLAPTADHDDHACTWGAATAVRTGIIADELTKPKLLAALRARHVYATTDSDLRIIAHVNGGLAGDILPLPDPGSELTIRIDLANADEDDAHYTVEVYSGVAGSHEIARKVNAVVHDAGSAALTIEDVRFEQPGQYTYFKITQANEFGDDDIAWTAPVWFGAPARGQPDAADSKLVASKKSALYHTNPDCPAARAIKRENRITGAAAKADGRQPHACPPANP